MSEKFYIGLDVGTDSCGWAVTDSDYNIKKCKGNAMWGIRLFDESKTAEDRRAFRIGRRRLMRRRFRLNCLENIFADEICKTDPEFFIRLKESNLYLEDKTTAGKYAIFTGEYTDKDFHKEYPTVYSLRRELVESEKPHDVRVVFLAIHHIIKYRGHFLFDDLGTDEVGDFLPIYESLTRYCLDNYDDIDLTIGDIESVKDIIRNNSLSKSAKKDELVKLYNITKKTHPQMFAVLGLLGGRTENMADIFGDDTLREAEKNSICFADKYAENEEVYRVVLGEKFEVITKLKAVYDWGVLANILQGEKYISVAKDKQYRKHNEDIKLLKKYVRSYFSQEVYGEIFKKSKKGLKNYVAYSGHVKKNGKTGVLNETATQAEFCDFLKKVLGECLDGTYETMFTEILAGDFCPKQRNADNGVIPMQIHRAELVKILQNAEKYLPFLTVKDKDGITSKQKIIDIFDYKIPYYVGPLNNHSGKYWVKRSLGKIYPWNVELLVDFDASAEAFIDNLTNKCTYLPQYDVMPVNSILYSRYKVLNEINPLKIDGEPISVELKQQIFRDLFLRRNRVNKKIICAYFDSKNIEYVTVTGIDDDIKSNMKSYRDFEEFSSLSIHEKDEIIEAITVFGDEKKLLRKRLEEKYGDKLSDVEIRKILKLKYTGWGNLSRELLSDVVSVYSKDGTGEVHNIMDALWNTNLNLMQLIYSEEFDFFNVIQIMKKSNNPDSLRKAVEDLYVSPKIKRPIYQALLIVKELVKTQGSDPEKIFLEVARYNGEKKRTVSRKKQLEELYKCIKTEYRDVYEELCRYDDDALKSDKLFLYFSQYGRCMYTGERIELDELIGSNSHWDIDHIYPRSKIKDDSIHNNRVLSSKSFNNGIKGNHYPLNADVRQKMSVYWKYLLDKKMITAEKYNRLICANPLTDEQLSVFISRQLVETQQSTKAIAEILSEMYPSTEIVYVKAGLVSDFRKNNDLVKSRDVNDLHHAKDAYLNIVVGNVYNVQCTHNKANFIKGLQSDSRDSYSLNGMFNFNIAGAWDVKTSMGTVRKQLSKNNILYTRYSYRNKGELFKRQPLKKGEGQIPLKAKGPRSDLIKYGAYNGATTYCYCLVKHGKSGKEKIGLFAVNLCDKVRFYNNPCVYLESQYKLIDPVILINDINIQSCLSFDGFRVHLGGKDSGGKSVIYRSAMQLVVDYETELYIKAIFKFFENNSKIKEPRITPYDGLTREKNMLLYGLITDKMQNTLFKVFYAGLGEQLAEKVETFDKMTVEKQCEILRELITLLHCNARLGNLKDIGITYDGKIRKGCNISSGDFNSVKLIHQSVTGLYEYQTELLNL